MKKIIFLFLVFLFSYSYSQSYIPMLQEGNTWSVDVLYSPLDPPNPPPYEWIITEQISLGNIESINGVDYTRIVVSGIQTCLLREENGFVYKYDEDDQIDRVLFDFTLDVGDSFLLEGSAYHFDAHPNCINGSANIDCSCNLTVAQVDFLEMAGTIRKVITFDQQGYYGPFAWIEGIGNISGFDFMWGIIDWTAGANLVCFETNGISYFFNDATSCDNTTLSIDDLDQDQIVLYPNPVTSVSILQFSSEGIVDLLKIYNVSGKLVKEEKVDKDHVLIDAMQYRSGLYFYQVFSENKLLKTEKFIIK